MPKRIQRKRTKGWKMPEGAVYVGRPTIFGNPFKVVKHIITSTCCEGPDTEWNVFNEEAGGFWRFQSREEAMTGSVNLFRAAAYSALNSTASWRRKVVFVLKDRDLACWCPLDQPCHADVLLEIANSLGGITE